MEIFEGRELKRDTWLEIIYYKLMECCLILLIHFQYFGFIYFFIPLCIFWRYLWPFYVLYTIWMVFDWRRAETTGGKWNCVQRWDVWKVRRDYFSMKLVKTVDSPPNKTYMVVGHPHGYFTFGGITAFMTNALDRDRAFPNFNVYGVTTLVTYLPLTKEINRILGYVSASEKGILNILNGPPGNVCGIIPGGVTEMCMCEPGTNRVFLKNRKGFVRIALKAGAALVPSYAFNETATYKSLNPSRWRVAMHDFMLKKFGVVFLSNAPIGFGRSLFFPDRPGIFPHKVPITVVVGKPIDLPKVENPSQELIDEYHGKFVQQLQLLFDTYKGKYDLMGDKATLSIE